MTLQKIGVAGRVYRTDDQKSNDVLKRDFRLGLLGHDSPIDSLSDTPPLSLVAPTVSGGKMHHLDHMTCRIRCMIASMAICHSVVPTCDEDSKETVYQASSPDEMALVQFAAEKLGVRLTGRSESEMALQLSVANARQVQINYDILLLCPFSSARRRMGIIVRERITGYIYYLLKGADQTVVPRLNLTPQWFLEEIESFSHSGLRTLVFARVRLTEDQYIDFSREYNRARVALVDRERLCEEVIESHLERSMELVGITGVEDELQQEVAQTMEILSQAGIKTWMLTGDKMETALCIATSAGFTKRHDQIIVITNDNNPTNQEIASLLMSPSESGLVGVWPNWTSEGTVLCVDGAIVERFIIDSALGALFIQQCCQSIRSVICCRCSPSQKAQVVKLFNNYNPTLRLAAIGDGGNDVPMINMAHCGIGLVGLEGRQASLASDFSIMEFRYLKRLLLWHGRLAHQRSAKLSGFVVHRGLVISAIQVIFSAIFYFTPLALFQGWLQVGYSTYYTMLPVFSLVLDVDLPESVAFLFPELYASQKKEGSLSDITFFKTLFKSIYQVINQLSIN